MIFTVAKIVLFAVMVAFCAAVLVYVLKNSRKAEKIIRGEGKRYWAELDHVEPRVTRRGKEYKLLYFAFVVDGKALLLPSANVPQDIEYKEGTRYKIIYHPQFATQVLLDAEQV